MTGLRYHGYLKGSGDPYHTAGDYTDCGMHPCKQAATTLARALAVPAPTPATDPRQRKENVGGPAVAAYFATPPTPEALLAAGLFLSDAIPDSERLAEKWAEAILAASPTLASAIALGLAWQRASAALPAGWVGPEMYHEPTLANDSQWRAVAYGPESTEWAQPTIGVAPTPEAALIALAEALEARRGE